MQHKPEISRVLWHLVQLTDNNGERLVIFDTIHSGVEYNTKAKILCLA